MEWINMKDQQPKHNQVVLASINGIYKIAKFDKIKNCLSEMTTNQSFSMEDKDLSVYWTKIETPLEPESFC